MGKTDKLADEVRFGLEEALPGMRKTILKKLPLAVAAMIQARTPNTMELSTLLALDTERADMREQWLRRLLTNRLIRSAGGLEPFARRALEQAAAGGQAILLSMDQTDLGDRFAVLMISVRRGDRSLPLVWRIEEGEANIGFAGQQVLLEQVRALVARRRGGDAAGGSILPLRGLVRVAPRDGLAVSAAPEGEPVG
jgi:hypothetical protein